MFYSADVGHEGMWWVGIARNAVFFVFHSFVASTARKVRFQKRELRRIGCPRFCQNLHHDVAPKRFGSQTCASMARPALFLKLGPAKFAPPFDVAIVKNWQHRGAFGSSRPYSLRHAVVREWFGSQNR